MKCLSYGALFLGLSVGFSIGFLDNKASAASIFDGLIQTTDEVVWEHSQSFNNTTCEPGQSKYTYKYNWRDILNEINTPQGDEIRNSFNAAVNSPDGQWLVVQRDKINGQNDWRGVEIIWSTDPNSKLEFSSWVDAGETYKALGISGNFKAAIIYDNSGRCGIENTGVHYVTNLLPRGGTIVDNYNNMPADNKLLLANYAIEYPENYEGEKPGDGVAPPAVAIRPHYSVVINPEGKLQVKYAKNIAHTFNGKSTLVLNKTYDDWTTESELDTKQFEPAHTLDYEYNLIKAAQHIKIIITHDQQHSDGDWNKSVNEIEKVEFELYWNGTSPVNFNNLEGCKNDTGETVACNNLTYEGMNPITAAFNKIRFGNHGLEGILYAPITFIATLPEAVGSCNPLYISWGSGQTIPCLGDKLGSFFGTNWSDIFKMFMNALIMIGVGFASFRFFKELHTPEKDKIEVMQL